MHRPTIQVFVPWRPKFGPQRKATGHPGQVRRAKRKLELRAEQAQTRPQDVTAWQELRRQQFEEALPHIKKGAGPAKCVTATGQAIPTKRDQNGLVNCPQCSKQNYAGWRSEMNCFSCHHSFSVA